MGVDEFIDQPGLSHPGFPNERHHLAVADSCTRQELVQGGHLRVAPHKARQATRHPGLEAATQRTGTDCQRRSEITFNGLTKIIH
jgi:hypothetical protein